MIEILDGRVISYYIFSTNIYGGAPVSTTVNNALTACRGEGPLN